MNRPFLRAPSRQSLLGAARPRVQKNNTLKRLLSISAVLLSALLIGLATSAVISLIQHKADQWRLGQILLMRLDKDVSQLHSVEVSDGPSVLVGDEVRLQALDAEAQQLLDDMAQIGDMSSPKISRAFLAYQAATEAEMRLAEAGRLIDAGRLHDMRVEPAYNALSEDITAADTAHEASAVSARTIANNGTRAVLTGTALLLSILVLRFGHAQRLSTQLATERETLRQSEERFRALIRNASDVIAIASPDGTLRYVSSAAQHLWGYAPERLEGTCVFDLMHPADAQMPQTLFAQAHAGANGIRTTELRLRHADGEWHLCEIVLTDLLAEPGIEGFVLTCRDISERKAFEQQLSHQAFHDALTGLPNRALFMERLRHALGRAERGQRASAVLFLDLDNFKIVNDSLGHEAGDFLLVTVAQRLAACVRAGDTVARLGGDEFTILLEDLAGDDEATGLAERIAHVLRTPFVTAGHEVFTTGSLGVAICRGDGRTSDELVRDADTAMYQAKTEGKARAVVFHSGMNVHALERLEMETDLRRALEKGEFRLFYQPLVSLETGQITEVEALLRWEHPERGLVPPLSFIPLAEQMGLIVPLGKWVMQEACRQALAWQREFPNRPPLTVGVNVSARQLHQPDFVEETARILAQSSLDASCLKLEITESVMMLEAEVTISKLRRLKNLGLCLAVDDFGTGYSSMSYLSVLPIDTLKIDRSFVGKINLNKEDEAIVRAIVTLAKTLKLRITSEGIETPEQLALLRGLGCDLGQGYLFARPMPPEQLAQMLACPASGQSSLRAALPRPQRQAA